MSFIEARKLIKSRTPRNGISYATAVNTKPTMRTMGTQTDSPLSDKNLTGKSSQGSTPIKTPIMSHKQPFRDTMPANSTQENKTYNKNKKSKITDAKSSESTVSANIPTKRKENIKKTLPSKIPSFKSQPNATSKTLTRTDFLKNPPPNQTSNVLETDDSLKMYVSAEEDMMTDDSEEDRQSTAPS